MSRIAAVARRIEAIVEAVTPESATHVGAARFVRADRPLGPDAASRTFWLAGDGEANWLGELSQDREGSLLEETFTLEIAYRVGEQQREIRDAIREDLLTIQHELLAPDNWLSTDWRCQRRSFRTATLRRSGAGTGAQIIAAMPIILLYRPF